MNRCRMALELKSTRSEYELKDASGYEFKVIAQQHVDGDWKGGWYANVTFTADGMNSAEAAVLKLLCAAEHFIRMLKEARDGES